MKCHDCVLMRTCRCNCRFCRLICTPDNFVYYIPDDWSGDYPQAAPIDKLISNYRKHNSEEETLAMLKAIGYSKEPTNEMIKAAIAAAERGDDEI